MTMGSVPTEIRTGTYRSQNPIGYDHGIGADRNKDRHGGEGKGNGDGVCEGLCERACEGFERRGDRACEGFEREGFWGSWRDHSFKAIKTARETNYQKAMRSPFPYRHRRRLQ